ncbi:MAG: hypothetical protein AN484_28340, partial [Aphanizomenon flos-aquae WA102]
NMSLICNELNSDNLHQSSVEMASFYLVLSAAWCAAPQGLPGSPPKAKVISSGIFFPQTVHSKLRRLL